MEARVILNTTTKLYDLVIKLDGIDTVLSTSKNFGHFQYHYNRGTLSKALTKHGITTFVYDGFTPSDSPPTNEPQVLESQTPNVEASWFETQSLVKFGAKKRGRPRKYVPKIIGVTVHKFSDEEPCAKAITVFDREAIERNFKMFMKTMEPKEALDEICLKFEIPYKQAYELVGSHI